MRIARFEHVGSVRVGLVDLEEQRIEVFDGDDVLAVAAGDASSTGERVALADVRLLAPIPVPPNFLAIGLNYADHVNESGRDKPEFPIFFNKQRTCVTGPFDPIQVPRASKVVDYEGELGVVIGRRCRHVPADRALDVIAGYLVVDDVSVRDWQRRSPTMTLGKSWDTHGPIGPWLTTPDEVPDPQALHLQTWVNGELLQDASTKEMVWSVAEQIEVLSTVCTLEPGTILATGTPAGVGIARKPPILLKPGDVVRRRQPRSGRPVRVPRLAERHRGCAALPVPHRHVVDDEVPRDHLERAVGRDVAAAATDDEP
jgi:2-keto-4-pentenoate hydratase/2-oxohepta-3-ene-1,7-dioic acid hydratase in catechol pathway